MKNLKGLKPLTRNEQKSINGGYNNGIKGGACLGEDVVCPPEYNMPCCGTLLCLTNPGGVRYCGQ